MPVARGTVRFANARIFAEEPAPAVSLQIFRNSPQPGLRGTPTCRARLCRRQILFACAGNRSLTVAGARHSCRFTGDVSITSLISLPFQPILFLFRMGAYWF